MSTPVQPLLEELIAWATPEEAKPDLLAARQEFFKKNGEVFDDERALEMRMAAFLEHYVCDRGAPRLGGVTPARARYLEALEREGPERARAFRALTATVHGLFEVRKLSVGKVMLRGLFSHLDFEVPERRQLVGLREGDVLECRLVPFDGAWSFSTAWCFHPHQVAKAIRQHVQRLARTKGHDESAFVADCAHRALKAERYRQIAVEKIYDFDKTFL